MSETIVVVDYGMGNLRSVAKALERVASPGQVVRVSDDPAQVVAATRVVVPGQGAARACMAALERRGLREAVDDVLSGQRPFLGICMGLQVLFEASDENEGTPCLGWVPGGVHRFPADSAARKIPQMGWNRVHQSRPHPLWAGIPDGSRFYFVHSFYTVPTDPAWTTGTTTYGVTYTSAIGQAHVFAVQFHPEKSADNGLRLLANFLAWDGRDRGVGNA